MSGDRQVLDAVPAGQLSPQRLLGWLWSATSRSPAWPLLILLSIFFAFQSPLFFTPLNINIILGQTVLVGILAIGLTPLAISGNIDLSVGAIAAVSTCLGVLVQGYFGFVPSVIAVLVVATLIGLVNGLIVERLGLNSIIVTLAMGTALHGAGFIIFGSQTILAKGNEYLDLGSLKIGGVSFSVILFLVIAGAAGGHAALHRARREYVRHRWPPPRRAQRRRQCRRPRARQFLPLRLHGGRLRHHPGDRHGRGLGHFRQGL